MKTLSAIGFALLLGLGNAYAQCTNNPPNYTKVASLSTVLAGKVVYVPNQWQESHCPGGQLWDYKRGPGHATDPTSQVGTWSVSTNGQEVTYNYGSGGSYTFTVYKNNSSNTYDFCGSSNVIGATITNTNYRCSP
ncbi:MAG: hypothetical protein Q7U85_08680 [Rhodocyclaceae bacterium]|nr:hypothetical protein [Rhodocyclaceae bacterium]